MELPMWVNRTLDSCIYPHESRYTKCSRLHSHHVAIIFQGRKVLAIGHNRVRSRNGNHQWTIHAEADAVRQLGDVSKLRGARMVVVRLTPTGLSCSAPCHSCAVLIEKCQREYGMLGLLHS